MDARPLESQGTPTMREKLARACATALTGGSPSKPKLIDYAAVDAILNVLRDPDETMIEAMMTKWGGSAERSPITAKAREEIFRAGIEAIINEGRG